jgi:signal transduction histidine kinase
MQHLHVAAQDAASRTSFLTDLFETFTPRQQCMNFEADVVWMHVLSDGLIALSYFSIPIALFYFVRRRRDLAFNWMFVMFALFILLCGTTHVFGVWAIWQPFYRLDGAVKLLTGMISATTAVLLWKLIPTALALPSPAQLRSANEQLRAEVGERVRAEEATARLAGELEQRVEERTLELAHSNRALRQEVEARTAAEDERNRLLVRERAARGEAERLNRVKDEFVATLSHELRTPLNAIFGWAQILREGGISADDRAQGLEVIERNARMQTQMIEDLLDVSRIASGKLRLEMRRFDLAVAARAALETIRPAAEARGLTLEAPLDGAEAPILGDPARMQQVLWNLLTNAVKFTPRGGRIRVELRRAETDVVVAVADTGAGIRPEFMPFLFERFHQADSSTTRRYGGLGLGLALVRDLVELHGGTVAAHSDGEGRGTTFAVRLPLAMADDAEGAERAAAPRPAGGSTPPDLTGVRVLVVEDDLDARDLLERTLAGAGAEVATAASVPAALAALDLRVPDVLVSDIGMPEQDGYDLIRAIRARDPAAGGNVPAVALTALARPDDRRRVLAAGFQIYVAKPPEITELLAVVASLAGRLGK